MGYSSLIDNLIEFRDRSNPYVDSMLGIANSKSKFKIIHESDPTLVEAVRQATCVKFRLNSDQEYVLNEVTKWFLKKPKSSKSKPAIEEKKENNEFEILGIEDALSSESEDDG